MITIYNLLVSFAKVLAAMSPWLVVGFFAAGVIAVWIPRAWVNRVMGGSSGFSGILRAVLVGVPLPICSCGVLPIATGLRLHPTGFSRNLFEGRVYRIVKTTNQPAK